MTDKTQIIHELGDKELLLPGLINDALRANDQTKYYFTLIQAARRRADDPDSPPQTLRAEREAAGVEDSTLDKVVEQSSRAGDLYRIPRLRDIDGRIKSSLDAMIKPLPDQEDYRRRLADLTAREPPMEDDSVPGEFIDRVTSVQGPGDSLHLLVMDVHKELNRLQASIYQESVDGAKVYGLSGEDDRVLVTAFMRGVNRTARLKFDHPGLGTTATRMGDTLVIQNDIGTTDAHVLVVKVTGLESDLTYADIHVERLAFFQSLLEQDGVKFTDATSRTGKGLEEESYFLTRGTFEADDRAHLERYLEHLGSRIVFLIDWNRARKRLQRFVNKKSAIGLLKWAADGDVGHMGFLKMGGDELIVDAIERTPKAQLRYGDKLADVLGRESANEFLKFVLKTCEEGMLEGKSEPLVRDEIRADLAERFHSIHEGLFEVARDHAELIVEISAVARDSVLKMGGGDLDMAGATRRAKRWERNADDLLNKARQIVKRTGQPREMERIISIADDAADSLEEAVFLLTLVPQGDGRPSFYQPLLELAELANKGSMEFLKVVEGARLVRKAGRQDLDDFLAAVDMTATIEHQADEVSRNAKALLISGARDFRELHLFDEITSELEQSTDAVMKAALVLRDYALEEVGSE